MYCSWASHGDYLHLSSDVIHIYHGWMKSYNVEGKISGLNMRDWLALVVKLNELACHYIQHPWSHKKKENLCWTFLITSLYLTAFIGCFINNAHSNSAISFIKISGWTLKAEFSAYEKCSGSVGFILHIGSVDWSLNRFLCCYAET